MRGDSMPRGVSADGAENIFGNAVVSPAITNVAIEAEAGTNSFAGQQRSFDTGRAIASREREVFVVSAFNDPAHAHSKRRNERQRDGFFVEETVARAEGRIGEAV